MGLHLVRRGEEVMIFDVKDTSFHRAQQKPTTRLLQIPVGSTKVDHARPSTLVDSMHRTSRHDAKRGLAEVAE